jgi:hypothetical protein
MQQCATAKYDNSTSLVIKHGKLQLFCDHDTLPSNGGLEGLFHLWLAVEGHSSVTIAPAEELC